MKLFGNECMLRYGTAGLSRWGRIDAARVHQGTARARAGSIRPRRHCTTTLWYAIANIHPTIFHEVFLSKLSRSCCDDVVRGLIDTESPTRNLLSVLLN